MKVTARTVAASLLLASCFDPYTATAFTPAKLTPPKVARVSTSGAAFGLSMSPSSTSSNTKYTVGIVGATGAVGKEIRQCLEDRNFPMDQLRIFGSSRSAGSIIETTHHGAVSVELFNVNAARECHVVFLAVSGDFALEHAKALTANEGCVVIDNSVRPCGAWSGGAAAAYMDIASSHPTH